MFVKLAWIERDLLLIDSEFTIRIKNHTSSLYDGGFVLNIYERRGLNVAANLLLYFRYITCVMHFCEDTLISYTREMNPKFALYEADIKKYMLLI